MNSLPKTVTRQRRGCDLSPGPCAPESRALTTRLPSVPRAGLDDAIFSENGPSGGMSIPLPRVTSRCVVVRMLTHLLRRIGCVVS